MMLWSESVGLSVCSCVLNGAGSISLEDADGPYWDTHGRSVRNENKMIQRIANGC